MIAAAALMAVAVGPASVAAQNAGPVKVTVTYTGKGTVDASHKLWVWIFDTPDIGPSAMPIGETSLDKNGATATFNAVQANHVWVAVAYDEKGGFAGMAPPPPGAPIAIHMNAKGPAAVTPGPNATVAVTFDASQRMP